MYAVFESAVSKYKGIVKISIYATVRPSFGTSACQWPLSLQADAAFKELDNAEGGDIYFSLSPVCMCMYTHIQQSRAAFEEKYGAVPQHPGITIIYTSTDIHYTQVLWRRFITLSPCSSP